MKVIRTVDNKVKRPDNKRGQNQNTQVCQLKMKPIKRVDYTSLESR